MAKRLPQNEQPYEPVKAALVQSVLAGPQAAAPIPPIGDGERQQPTPHSVATHTNHEPRTEAQKSEPNRPGLKPLDGGLTLAREQLVNSERQRQPTLPPPVVQAPEGLTREKRCLLTRVEEIELEALVQRMANELRTPVKFSHVLRAAMAVIRHAEAEIIDAAKQMGPITRPANSDATRLAEFELRLAVLLATAFRKAPPFRG